MFRFNHLKASVTAMQCYQLTNTSGSVCGVSGTSSVLHFIRTLAFPIQCVNVGISDKSIEES